VEDIHAPPPGAPNMKPGYSTQKIPHHGVRGRSLGLVQVSSASTCPGFCKAMCFFSKDRARWKFAGCYIFFVTDWVLGLR
jgi:hypothetical protein